MARMLTNKRLFRSALPGGSTRGVVVFDTADDKHVVSVEHIGEDADSGNGVRRRFPRALFRAMRYSSGMSP
jgi:hypothetical protein